MPAIITGAAGFIGSHLKNKLGSKTKCCDPADLSMMCPSTLEEIINNKKLSIEAVFHLGAISSTTESNIIKLTDNNILFSCRLLDACIKNNIPFREIAIQNNDPQTLGELFSYFILETILVGRLAGINPFNQPAVEQVKIQTKKELSK